MEIGDQDRDHVFYEFPSILMSQLNEQRLDGDNCDVTLIANDGVTFKAHKAVLSSYSRYFKMYFLTNQRTKQVQDRIELGGFCSRTIGCILEAFYTSRLVLNIDLANKVLLAADVMEVYRISEVCKRYLAEHKTQHSMRHIGPTKPESSKSSLVHGQSQKASRTPGRFREPSLRKSSLDLSPTAITNLVLSGDVSQDKSAVACGETPPAFNVTFPARVHPDEPRPHTSAFKPRGLTQHTAVQPYPLPTVPPFITVPALYKQTPTQQPHGSHTTPYGVFPRAVCPHCRVEFMNPWMLELHDNLYHRPVLRNYFPPPIQRTLSAPNPTTSGNTESSSSDDSNITSSVRGNSPQQSSDIEIVDEVPNRNEAVATDARHKRAYQCDLCNASFPSKAGLSVHFRLHTGERPYQCTICHKSFTQLGHVQRHQKVHTGEKPYQCGICHARVRDKASMRYHIQAHKGVKPFHCDQCDARFTKRSSLVKHKNVHTGEYMHQCQQCKASFREKASLSRHKRCQHSQHTDE